MNLLSQAIKNGHYPKRMVVSKDDAFTIREYFYTNWSDEFDSFEALTGFNGSFYAYYITVKGHDRKCLISFK